MLIPIETEVTVYGEYVDEEPNIARTKLTEEKIAWLKKMQRVIKRNKIVYLTDYDCIDYFHKDETEEEEDSISEYTMVECEMVVVKKDGFFWKGVIKHSDPAVHYETELITFKYLDELIQFYTDTPANQLPKYIKDEDYSTREIALYRMKGEQGA